MAKADLLRLAEKAMSHLEKSRNFRNISNRQPHIFLIDKDNILRQILTQINRKRKPTKKQFEALEQSVEAYIQDLYGTFRNRTSKEYTYRVFGRPPSFKVLVVSKTGKGDVFRKIREIRSGRRNEIKLAKSIADIFSRDASITEERLAHLFDLGHMEGSSVAEQRVQAALAKFTTVNSSIVNSQQLDRIINLAVSTKERSGGQTVGKDFVVTVTDESFSANQLKGSAEEKEFVAEAQKLLAEFIENNNDWANQKGSRSATEIIMAELINTAIKRGAKAKKQKVSVSKSEKVAVKKRIRSKKPVAVNLDAEDVSNQVPAQERARTNWLSLINIINARLTPKVVANMKFPALQNRTGTFAGSAEVLTVESSREGYPTFVFDYERNPYDVFDRTLGRSPWNTPERDPRALVDKSVREVVREMAIGRFYTRRA